MPEVVTGPVRFKRLLGKVHRSLIVMGVKVEAANEAVESLRELLTKKASELGVKDEDIVEAVLVFEKEDDEIRWDEERTTIIVYKPAEEVDRLVKEVREAEERAKEVEEKLQRVKRCVKDLKRHLASLQELLSEIENVIG